MNDVIRTRALHKRYGNDIALHPLDLSVEAGEVLGVLGPNGAGKTTLVEMLEGLRSPTSGELRVLGQDPRRAGPAWRDRIGVVLQQPGLLPELTVAEVIGAFGRYYRTPRAPDRLLEDCGLTGQRHKQVQILSGGQLRRLDLALAVLGQPDLLFLDEPTTGLDPEIRRQTWHLIDRIRSDGTTVVLTTHYLDEAEALADRLIVLVNGKIRAEGHPATIGNRHNSDTTIRFHLDTPVEVHGLGRLDPDEGIVELRTSTPTRDLGLLTSWAAANRRCLTGLEVRPASLEDTYLELLAS